jgi:hypothetical protein
VLDIFAFLDVARLFSFLEGYELTVLLENEAKEV